MTKDFNDLVSPSTRLQFLVYTIAIETGIGIQELMSLDEEELLKIKITMEAIGVVKHGK